MKKDNENAALLSMFDELVDEIKKNRQAIMQLQNTIQRHDIGKIVDESIYIALNEKFPNKSQQEKDEELHLRRGAEDFVHDPHDNHGHQAHEVVDEVAGGDDVAAVVGVAVVLQECIERHKISSAKGAGEC